MYKLSIKPVLQYVNLLPVDGASLASLLQYAPGDALSGLGFPPGIPSRTGQTELNIGNRLPMYKGAKEQHRTGQKNNLDGITQRKSCPSPMLCPGDMIVRHVALRNSD